MALRVTIRVRPGASRTAVGGLYGAGALVVAVTARAVDGAANRAVIEALALAFSVRPREVRILTGAAARSKVVVVEGDHEVLAGRLAVLLGG